MRTITIINKLLEGEKRKEERDYGTLASRWLMQLKAHKLSVCQCIRVMWYRFNTSKERVGQNEIKMDNIKPQAARCSSHLILQCSRSTLGKYFLHLKCEKKKTRDWDAECSEHYHNHSLKWNIWTQKVDNCNWNALPKLKLCKCSLLRPEFRYKTPSNKLRYNEKPSKQVGWSCVKSSYGMLKRNDTQFFKRATKTCCADWYAVPYHKRF